MSMTYEQLGQQVGAIVEQKREAYGDSISKVDAMMQVLYPDGVSPAQVAVFGILNRTLDKVVRIVTDNDPSGENPWIDGAGYMLRGAMYHKERKNQGCGSVKEAGAAEESMAQSASAARSAATLTMLNASASNELRSERESAKKPAGSSPVSASPDASAPSAMEAASRPASEDVRVRNKGRTVLNILRERGWMSKDEYTKALHAMGLLSLTTMERQQLLNMRLIQCSAKDELRITNEGLEHLLTFGVYQS